MAIALEDVGQNSSNTGVVLTPAGGAPASGEVIYIAVDQISNSINNFPSSYDVSGGGTWTQLIKIDNDLYGELVLLRKVAGASEPSSYTVTVTGGNMYRLVGGILVLSGVDNTTPNGTAVSLFDTSDGDSTFSIPALTTTAANSWDLVVLGGTGAHDPSATVNTDIFGAWGSSLIERVDIAHDFGGCGMATALRASAGVQAATTAGGWVDPNFAIRVEIFEAAGGAAVTAQSHFRWREDDGSETTATWLDAEDASITRARSTNTRLRVQVDTTNDLASSAMQLEYKLSTDATYAKVQVPDATASAFGAIGADTTTGTTPLSVAYPAGITAGQLLAMVVGHHPDTATVSTPSGWVAPTNNTTTGGAGALAADTGPRRITVFTKVADGTESGSVSLTITGCTGAGANIFRCTKSPSKDWAVACAIGADNSAGVGISATFGSDPGVTAGDLVFVGFVNCADTAAHASEALTQTGITYGTMTEHKDYAVATGTPDLRMVLTQHAVTSGTSSAAATWVATASGTASASSAGPAIMIRARAQDQAFLMATSANVAASGEATTAQLTAPAGKSTSDFDAGRLMDDENPADAIDIDADDYTEVEWCIQASAVAADGTYQFRVTRTGTVLDTYTVTPTWTIGAAAAGQPTFKRGRGVPGMRLGGTTFGQGF